MNGDMKQVNAAYESLRGVEQERNKESKKQSNYYFRLMHVLPQISTGANDKKPITEFASVKLDLYEGQIATFKAEIAAAKLKLNLLQKQNSQEMKDIVSDFIQEREETLDLIQCERDLILEQYTTERQYSAPLSEANFLVEKSRKLLSTLRPFISYLEPISNSALEFKQLTVSNNANSELSRAERKDIDVALQQVETEEQFLQWPVTQLLDTEEPILSDDEAEVLDDNHHCRSATTTVAG